MATDPNLVDIMNAIADVTIVMPDPDPVQVPCYRMEDAKAAVSSGHLPVRIILPPGGDGNTAVADFSYTSYGQATVTWRVTELMLWRAVASGAGPAGVWQKLTEYISTYISTFAGSSQRHLTSRATVTNFEPSAAVLEYPQASGNEYHGVQMTVLVTETIC